MTWFKVSDDFHAHPKATAAGPAALGLWVIAGSWSSANGTGGFVPDHVLPRLTSDATKLARKLVAVGLWRRTSRGFQFHQWEERNPSSHTVKALRNSRSDAAKRANHVRWHEQKSINDPNCPHCR